MSYTCGLILSVAHSMCDSRSQNPLGADREIIQSEKSESLKLATGFNNNLIINKNRWNNLRKISLSGQYLCDDQFIYLLFIVTKKLRFIYSVLITTSSQLSRQTLCGRTIRCNNTEINNRSDHACYGDANVTSNYIQAVFQGRGLTIKKLIVNSSRA